MECLHPHCPRSRGLASWGEVVTHPSLKIRLADRARILAALNTCGDLGTFGAVPQDVLGTAAFRRVLTAAPCLYSQLPVKVTARAVVHLCEITLGCDIVSSNVYEAFKIQHPTRNHVSFTYPPLNSGAAGGDIMEALCSEVLENHGIPHMILDGDGWPAWDSKSHVSLNTGKMRPLKLYGDILIPCAPHNLLVSVKSEAARERFVVSGNRLESVGFGFFSDANEFWTSSRMNLLKRWGFVAVYMPEETLREIQDHLRQAGTESDAININGRPLFRALSEFGGDMCRVAGRLSMTI